MQDYVVKEKRDSEKICLRMRDIGWNDDVQLRNGC